MTEETPYEFKTCDLFSGSVEPLLTFGAIADLEVFDDNDIRATVVATQKAFDLRLAAQDVLVLMGDIDPEHDPNQLPADETQFSDLNRVRVWSQGVLVFDRNIGDYDVADFDGTNIMGYLEDGTAIALYLGRDTRVLLEQLD